MAWTTSWCPPHRSGHVFRKCPKFGVNTGGRRAWRADSAPPVFRVITPNLRKGAHSYAPSPLRTVRDNLSSYGSSPGHLIAFSGVPLMMAPGMDHSAVVEVVRPCRLAWD